MRQPPTFAALLLALTLLALPAAAQDAPLSTVAERTGFVQTGRYPEAAELCGAFAATMSDPAPRPDLATPPEDCQTKGLGARDTAAVTPDKETSSVDVAISETK